MQWSCLGCDYGSGKHCRPTTRGVKETLDHVQQAQRSYRGAVKPAQPAEWEML